MSRSWETGPGRKYREGFTYEEILEKARALNQTFIGLETLIRNPNGHLTAADIENANLKLNGLIDELDEVLIAFLNWHEQNPLSFCVDVINPFYPRLETLISEIQQDPNLASYFSGAIARMERRKSLSGIATINQMDSEG